MWLYKDSSVWWKHAFAFFFMWKLNTIKKKVFSLSPVNCLIDLKFFCFNDFVIFSFTRLLGECFHVYFRDLLILSLWPNMWTFFYEFSMFTWEGYSLSWRYGVQYIAIKSTLLCNLGDINLYFGFVHLICVVNRKKKRS